MRVEGVGDAVQAGCECEGWGVEVFVGDAEDVSVLNGAEVLPVALFDGARERDAVACAAPGEEEDVGAGGGDGFGIGVCAGCAEERAAGCCDEFGDPVLGVDEGFAPLFAVDFLFGEGLGSGADFFDAVVELFIEGFAGFWGLDEVGEDSCVVGDVGEGVRGESEDGQAGFEDGREGFHAVGDAGDDDVGLCSENLFGVRGPGVVQYGDVELGEFGHDVEAVFCAGAEVVQLAEVFEGDGDGWLQ